MHLALFFFATAFAALSWLALLVATDFNLAVLGLGLLVVLAVADRRPA